MHDPNKYSILLTLKSTATHGGEFGRHFDLGVLSVISQIENTDKFAPNHLARHVIMHKEAPYALKPEELQSVERYLKASEMTQDEAVSFSKGVNHAESYLAEFSDAVSQGTNSNEGSDGNP